MTVGDKIGTTQDNFKSLQYREREDDIVDVIVKIMIITGLESNKDYAEIKAKLLGSLLLFTQTFFNIRTGREFVISSPIAREPHQITIARQLTRIFDGLDNRVWMTLPPGHGKSTFVTYFIPWCFAHFPDCRFIYISYSADLAASHTYNIRSIMEIPSYQKLFGVCIDKNSSAKDNFRTIEGGNVRAFGSGGAITGQDAGLPNLDRFSGAVIMDDMHKPDEVFSDTIRDSVINNYNQTIKMRPRSPIVPIIGIGHALHEDDLRNFLLSGKDGYKWKNLTLKAEDEAGNILAPNLITREMLNAEKEFNPYVYHAQYQGDPKPADGGIFKEEWFELIDTWPTMKCTFITVDTAESVKNYSDYSVFSFWGIYDISYKGKNTGEYGLHWIDCFEERIEPADLEDMFMSFYHKCLCFGKTPKFIAIEKKSTGTTLISILNKVRGFHVKNIERTKASGSKTARYLEMQQYISRRLISLPKYSNHSAKCIEHMKKITVNNTHSHDDICDTAYDAVKIAFIDKYIELNETNQSNNEIMKEILRKQNRIDQLRTASYGGKNYRR